MIYKKNEKCIEERTDGCIIVYDSEADMTHIFNETATWLWEKMTEDGFELNSLISEFIAALKDAQNIDLNEVYSDCLECIQTMHKQGLLLKISDD